MHLLNFIEIINPSLTESSWDASARIRKLDHSKDLSYSSVSAAAGSRNVAC